MPLQPQARTTPARFCICSRGARVAHGFTMIELMITLVILVILISVAAPSLSDLVRDQRVKTATFDVYAGLAFARSEAIKRNADVDITPTGADWAGGWRVEVQSDATVLKRQDALNGMNVTGPAGTVTYRRDGRIFGAAPPTFVVKSSESNTITARCVRVDLSGRPNIKLDTNGDPTDGCQ